MEAIIVHPKDKEQLNVIEYFLNTLKIPFDKTKEDGSNFNGNFDENTAPVAEVKIAGMHKSMKIEDLWK